MIYLEVLRDHLTREMKGSWFSYLPHSHWIARQEIREGYCMDEDRSAIARMRAITISREYGSGGGEIGARLAKRLGWQLIDHEVVVWVGRLIWRTGVTSCMCASSPRLRRDSAMSRAVRVWIGRLLMHVSSRRTRSMPAISRRSTTVIPVIRTCMTSSSTPASLIWRVPLR